MNKILSNNLKNSQLKTYVGYTNNLKKRLKLHNDGKGAKSTKGRTWKFYYYRKYNRLNILFFLFLFHIY